MSDDAEADLSRALDRQRAQLAPHWEKVASLLSLIWKWPVPVSYASDYRYQRDRLELRRDDNGEPLFDAEEIAAWANQQFYVYGRGIRPLQGVYFLQADYKGLVKIGFATDLLRRAEAYATHCPCELNLVGFIFGNIEHEREVHHALDKWRVRGEWFHPSEELISFVREVQDRVDFSAPHNAMYRRLLNKSIFGER